MQVKKNRKRGCTAVATKRTSETQGQIQPDHSNLPFPRVWVQCLHPVSESCQSCMSKGVQAIHSPACLRLSSLEKYLSSPSVSRGLNHSTPVSIRWSYQSTCQNQHGHMSKVKRWLLFQFKMISKCFPTPEKASLSVLWDAAARTPTTCSLPLHFESTLVLNWKT